jgi:glucokinase
VIILGGGMSKSGDFLIDLVQKYIQKKTWTILKSDIKLVIAQSSNNAGIMGAAMAAKQKIDTVNKT